MKLLFLLAMGITTAFAQTPANPSFAAQCQALAGEENAMACGHISNQFGLDCVRRLDRSQLHNNIIVTCSDYTNQYSARCLKAVPAANEDTVSGCSNVQNQYGVDCVSKLTESAVTNNTIVTCSSYNNDYSVKCLNHVANADRDSISACLNITTNIGLECVKALAPVSVMNAVIGCSDFTSSFSVDCIKSAQFQNPQDAMVCSNVKSRISRDCVKLLGTNPSYVSVIQCSDIKTQLGLKCVESIRARGSNEIQACLAIQTATQLDCVRNLTALDNNSIVECADRNSRNRRVNDASRSPEVKPTSRGASPPSPAASQE